jgi:hypothetical protein
MATTRFALPICAAAAATRSGFSTAAVMIERRHDRDLVGTRVEQVPHVLERAHATADGERHEDRLGGPRDHVEDDATLLMAGRDVQEGDLVRLLLVVEACHVDGVPGVHVIHVAHALHHPTLIHVEAGDDALQEHAAISSARSRSTSPV